MPGRGGAGACMRSHGSHCAHLCSCDAVNGVRRCWTHAWLLGCQWPATWAAATAQIWTCWPAGTACFIGLPLRCGTPLASAPHPCQLLWRPRRQSLTVSAQGGILYTMDEGSVITECMNAFRVNCDSAQAWPAGDTGQTGVLYGPCYNVAMELQCTTCWLVAT
jgi:hypothetical protein